MGLSVSLVVTTYNSPEFLTRVFQSINLQTFPVREVLIADDGSDSNNRTVIDRWSETLPIVHVWQPDKDFRASSARNLAVLKSSGSYIIFIDGDCLLPPDFIASHVALAKENKIVAGGRYLWQASDVENVIGDFPRSYKFWRMPLGSIRDLWASKWSVARTCNLSLFKHRIMAVCGFDESYVGWGREDSDFVIRLIRHGLSIRSARFAATVAHLKHPKESRVHLIQNDHRLDNLLFEANRVLPLKSRLFSE